MESQQSHLVGQNYQQNILQSLPYASADFVTTPWIAVKPENKVTIRPIANIAKFLINMPSFFT